MGVIHLGPLSALPGTCIVLCALAMLYDPGGTCTVLAYRPAHYCLRPKVEYRLPLVVLSRLNRFTLSHYGSRTPLSTLHAGLTASHARLSTGCLLGFAGPGLSPDYTIHAELAHNLRTLYNGASLHPIVSRETFQKTQPVLMTRCVFISSFPEESRWGPRRRR